MQNRFSREDLTRLGRRIFLTLCFVLLTVTGRAETNTEYDSFAVGEWYGRAYRSELTNEFSHCGLDASYSNDTALIFDISRDRKAYLGFINQKWSLSAADSYEVQLEIDDNWRARFKAEPRGAQAIGLRISDDVLDRLANGRVLNLRTAQQSYRFKLTKTRAAIKRLRRCVDISLAAEQAGMKFNPFVPKADGDAASQSSVAATDGNGIGLDNDGMKRLLRDAGMSTFQMLDRQIARKLQPQMRYMWTDGRIFGGVFQTVSAFTVDDYAPIAISQMSKGCKGEFASAGEHTFQTKQYEAKSLAWKCLISAAHSYSGAMTLVRRNQVTTIFFHWGSATQFTEISDANQKIQRYFETKFAH